MEWYAKIESETSLIYIYLMPYQYRLRSIHAGIRELVLFLGMEWSEVKVQSVAYPTWTVSEKAKPVS